MTTSTTNTQAVSKIKNAQLSEFRLWDSRGPTDYVYIRRKTK